MASIKSNFAYSSILTIAGYLFPLLTYPYVTRVLGPEALGCNNFVDSITHYFTFLSMMGMGVLGVREIAKYKNDKIQLSKSFNSLLLINLLTSGIAIVGLLIFVYVSPRLKGYTDFFYIGAARILFGTLIIEWFFKGIENFRYITIRSLIIRIIYVISVFIFVHSPSDVKLYFLLTSCITFVNAICNLSYSTRFVKFSFKDVRIGPYLKPFIVLGVYQLLVTTYTTLNAVYLGFVSNDAEVGYYTIVTKLYYIILSVFTAFTGVMLPRMTALNFEGSSIAYKSLIEKSINALFAISFPLIIITEICAPQIIYILAGDGFNPSIDIMRIIMPLIFVVGYEQILVVQILTSLGKDKVILLTSIVGASTAIFLNIVLVPLFYSIGSAFVWVFSEICVLLVAQLFVTKYIDFYFPVKLFVVNLLYSLPITVIGFIIMRLTSYNILSFVVFTILLFIYFFVVELYIMKNQIVISLFEFVLSRLKFKAGCHFDNQCKN